MVEALPWVLTGGAAAAAVLESRARSTWARKDWIDEVRLMNRIDEVRLMKLDWL